MHSAITQVLIFALVRGSNQMGNRELLLFKLLLL